MAERQLLVRILGDSAGAKGAVDSLGGATSALTEHMGALAAGIGAALSVTAVVGFAKKSVDAFKEVAGETQKLQWLMGGSAEDASRLRTAFEESGISADAGANAMKKFSKAIEGGNVADEKQLESLKKKNEALSVQWDKIENLKNPTEAQKEQQKRLAAEMNANAEAMQGLTVGLDKYGLSTVDANGKQKDMHTLLLEASDIFKKMPDGIQKNALAMQMFGKSGTDMLPFLNRGAEGIKELEKESDKYGLTLKQSNIDALQKSKEAHRQLHAAMLGLQVQIGAHLFPILVSFTTFLAANVPPALAAVRDFLVAHVFPILDRFATWFKAELPVAFGVLRSALTQYVLPALGTLRDILLNDVVPAMSTVFEFVSAHREILVGVGVAIAAIVVPSFIAWAIAAGSAALATLAAIAPVILIGAAITALVAGLIYAYNHFQTFHDVVDTVIHAVQAVVVDVLDYIQAHWREWADALVSFGQTAFDTIRTIIETVLGAIEAFWRTWGGNITSVVTGVFDGVRDYVQGVIEVVRGIIQTVMALIHGDWSGAWDGIKLIFSGAWDMMKGEVETAIALIKGAIEAAMRLIAGIFSNGWDLIKSATVTFFEALPGLAESAGKALITALWDAIKAAFQAQWDLAGIVIHGIASAMDDIITAAENIGTQIIDAVVRIIKSAPGALLDALKSIIPSAGDVVGGIVGGITGHIPGLHAAGGFPQGMSWVGENGPELVDFGRGGARVHSAQQSQRLLAGGGGTNVTVIQNFNGPAPTGEAATHLQNQAAAQFGRELVVALRGAA